MGTGNLEIIRDHYAAGGRGDLEGMLAAFAPDIEWKEMDGFPYAGTYHGPDEVVSKVFARLGQDWKGFRVDVDELLDAGDAIVMVGKYGGTNRETGKPLDVRVIHVWRLRDGKAVAFEQFTDTLKVAEAMEG